MENSKPVDVSASPNAPEMLQSTNAQQQAGLVVEHSPQKQAIVTTSGESTGTIDKKFLPGTMKQTAPDRKLCPAHEQQIALRQLTMTTAACQTESTEILWPMLCRTILTYNPASIEGELQLVIPDIRNLEKTVRGPERLIRNVSWRIVAMPYVDTDTSEKYLGFYIECCPETYSNAWSCKANAELRLVAQWAGVPNWKKHTSHVYTAKASNFGYATFMKWDDVINGNRGFIRDNCVILQASVKTNKTKNIISADEFHKEIEKWLILAKLQLTRNEFDLAIDAINVPFEYCKKKGVEPPRELIAQKEVLIQKKLDGAIDRIEAVKKSRYPDLVSNRAYLCVVPAFHDHNDNNKDKKFRKITLSSPLRTTTSNAATTEGNDDCEENSMFTVKSSSGKILSRGRFNPKIFDGGLQATSSSAVHKFRMEQELYMEAARLVAEKTDKTTHEREVYVVRFAKMIENHMKTLHYPAVMNGGRKLSYDAQQVRSFANSAFNSEKRRQMMMNLAALKARKYEVKNLPEVEEHGTDAESIEWDVSSLWRDNKIEERAMIIEHVSDLIDVNIRLFWNALAELERFTDSDSTDSDSMSSDESGTENNASEKIFYEFCELCIKEQTQNSITTCTSGSQTEDDESYFNLFDRSKTITNSNFPRMLSPEPPSRSLIDRPEMNAPKLLPIDPTPATVMSILTDEPIATNLPSTSYASSLTASSTVMSLPINESIETNPPSTPYATNDTASTSVMSLPINESIGTNPPSTSYATNDTDSTEVMLIPTNASIESNPPQTSDETPTLNPINQQELSIDEKTYMVSILATNLENTRQIFNKAGEFINIIGKNTNDANFRTALRDFCRVSGVTYAENKNKYDQLSPLEQIKFDQHDLSGLFEKFISKEDSEFMTMNDRVTKFDEYKAKFFEFTFLNKDDADCLLKGSRSITSKIVNFEKEVDSLYKQNNDLETKNKKLEKQMREETKSSQSLADKMKAKSTQLTKEIKDKSRALKIAENRASSLQTERDELVKKQMKTTTELAVAQSKLDKEIAGFKSEIEKLQEQKKELQGLLSCRNEENKVLKNQKIEIEREIKKLKKEIVCETDKITKIREEEKMQLERAMESEIALLQYRLDAGLSLLDRAVFDAEAIIRETKEASYDRARTASEVSLCHQSCDEWRQLIDEVKKMIHATKMEHEAQIESIKKGTPLDSLPEITVPKPPPAPQVVTFAPSTSVAPVELTEPQPDPHPSETSSVTETTIFPSNSANGPGTEHCPAVRDNCVAGTHSNNDPSLSSTDRKSPVRHAPIGTRSDGTNVSRESSKPTSDTASSLAGYRHSGEKVGSEERSNSFTADFSGFATGIGSHPIWSNDDVFSSMIANILKKSEPSSDSTDSTNSKNLSQPQLEQQVEQQQQVQHSQQHVQHSQQHAQHSEQQVQHSQQHVQHPTVQQKPGQQHPIVQQQVQQQQISGAQHPQQQQQALGSRYPGLQQDQQYQNPQLHQSFQQYSQNYGFENYSEMPRQQMFHQNQQYQQQVRTVANNVGHVNDFVPEYRNGRNVPIQDANGEASRMNSLPNAGSGLVANPLFSIMEGQNYNQMGNGHQVSNRYGGRPQPGRPQTGRWMNQ